jgi:hypothetical protein
MFHEGLQKICHGADDRADDVAGLSFTSNSESSGTRSNEISKSTMTIRKKILRSPQHDTLLLLEIKQNIASHEGSTAHPGGVAGLVE